MSEPLIVYVCECERLPTADQDGAPWEQQEVGEPCSLCLATVRAVNITELEADRARLQAENERLLEFVKTCSIISRGWTDPALVKINNMAVSILASKEQES